MSKEDKDPDPVKALSSSLSHPRLDLLLLLLLLACSIGAASFAHPLRVDFVHGGRAVDDVVEHRGDVGQAALCVAELITDEDVGGEEDEDDDDEEEDDEE